MFISFEGIDCSGKTTQLTRVIAWFEAHGLPCLLVREPGGTAVSERIRALLLDPTHRGMDSTAEMFLFSAARSQLVRERILPALAAGTPVFADRFHDSTTAYQGYGRGIDLASIRHVHSLATHGCVPDLTLFFDISVEESMRRLRAAGRGADRMEDADAGFFQRVRYGYRALADEHRDRFVVIDGGAAVDVITARVRDLLQARFETLRAWSAA
jgi:dTMP kinase